MRTCRCTRQLRPGQKLCNECKARYENDVAYDHAQDSHAWMLAALGTEVRERGSFVIDAGLKVNERQAKERELTPRGAIAVQLPREPGGNHIYNWTRVRHEVSI